MEKISKDNVELFRLFGACLFVGHAVFIVFVIVFNFWLVYLIYLFFAAMQFGIGRVWRYVLIDDAYLSDDLKFVPFKNSKDKTVEFECYQVPKCSTRFGITDVTIDTGKNKLRFYFRAISKDYLKYLSA